MKLKSIIIISLFTFFGMYSIGAQDLNFGSNLDDLILRKLREKDIYSEDQPKDYTGSPYTNDEFISGEIKINPLCELEIRDYKG